MKKLSLLLAAVCVLASLSACGGDYNGPTVSRVGVGGTYTSKDGESYGGEINADLAYPLPSPRPVRGGK